MARSAPRCCRSGNTPADGNACRVRARHLSGHREPRPCDSLSHRHSVARPPRRRDAAPRRRARGGGRARARARRAGAAPRRAAAAAGQPARGAAACRAAVQRAGGLCVRAAGARPPPPARAGFGGAPPPVGHQPGNGVGGGAVATCTPRGDAQSRSAHSPATPAGTPSRSVCQVSAHLGKHHVKVGAPY